MENTGKHPGGRPRKSTITDRITAPENGVFSPLTRRRRSWASIVTQYRQGSETARSEGKSSAAHGVSIEMRCKGLRVRPDERRNYVLYVHPACLPHILHRPRRTSHRMQILPEKRLEYARLERMTGPRRYNVPTDMSYRFKRAQTRIFSANTQCIGLCIP